MITKKQLKVVEGIEKYLGLKLKDKLFDIGKRKSVGLRISDIMPHSLREIEKYGKDKFIIQENGVEKVAITLL